MDNEIKMSALERKLLVDVNGKELWGDIKLSKDDFDSLVNFLRAYVHFDDSYLKKACENYPISVTTFLVFLSRYKYNTNFWGAAAELLGIENTQQNEKEMGTCALKSFDLLNFDYSYALSSGRKYVDSIIYESGLPPESNLSDLFYILKYDNQSVFDPIGVIDDLISSRSYAIRKPLLKFLNKFKSDRAVDLLIDAYDAINCVDSNMSGDSPYVDNYREWKESEKSTEKAFRSRQENQAKPYLKFDERGKGLCIVLPRFNLADEWIDEVKWVIETSEGHYIEKTLLVSGEDDKRYTDSIMIPVSPSKKYFISLADCENLSDSKYEYTVPGISEKGYLLFNAFGRQTNSTFLPYPECIMVLDDTVSIDSISGLSQTLLSYPTDKAGYTVLAFDASDTNSQLVFTSNNKRIELSSRPQVKLILEGSKLLGLSDNSIFTTIPTLRIVADEGVNTDNLILKLSNSEKKFALDDYFDNFEAVIDLSNVFNSSEKDASIRFGSYAVRIYQRNHFLKQMEFYYVPEIKTDYRYEQSWVNKDNRKAGRNYKFMSDERFSLAFEGCIVRNEDKHYIVEIPADKSSVHVMYRETQDNGICCNFELPVLPFKADLLNAYGNVAECVTDKAFSIDSGEIIKDNNEYWLNLNTYGNFKAFSYSLQLETVNGIEQNYYINNLRNGCTNLNLSIFYDTIRNCPLPAQIVLSCSESDYSVPLILIKEAIILSKKPKYHKQGFIILSPEDEVKNLVLKRFGSDEIMKLPANKSKILPFGSQTEMVRAFKCERLLEEGLYNLETEQTDNIFDFDESDISTFSFGIGTFYVNYDKNNDIIDSFSSWINAVIYGLVNKKFFTIKDKLSDYLELLSKISDKQINEKDYEKLVSLAFFYENEKEKAKKLYIKECINLISHNILSGYDRFNIVKKLKAFHVSEELFDICLQEYNLFIFETEEDVGLLSEEISLYSNEISLLMKFKNDAPIKSVIKNEKYMELIGKDTLGKMIVPPNTNDKNEAILQQKMFLNEKSPCYIRIELPSEISGEMKPIQDMITYTSKSVYLNMSKKPDTGIYFYRIRYVDQYINWFKLNYNCNCEIKPETKEYMSSIQSKYTPDIIDCLDYFKKKYSFVLRYDGVLKKRYENDAKANLNTPIPARFFYVLGASTLLISLKTNDESICNKLKSAEKFISGAISIAPKMTRRDILMAQLYHYLVRKEEKLCQ